MVSTRLFPVSSIHLVLYRKDDGGRQVHGKDLGVKVLEDGFNRFPREIFHFNPAFHVFEIFFNAPSKGIEFQEKFIGEDFGIEKGRHQDLVVSRGKRDANQANGNGSRGQPVFPALLQRIVSRMDGNDAFPFGGEKELGDFAPRSLTNSRAERDGFGAEPSENPESGISAIQKDQVVRGELRAVEKSQVSFVNPIGMNNRAQRKTVQAIVELRGPSQGTLVDGRLREEAEIVGLVGNGRKLKNGTINSQETETVPCPKGKMFFNEREQMGIEFNERLILEFVSSL